MFHFQPMQDTVCLKHNATLPHDNDPACAHAHFYTFMTSCAKAYL